jgi:GH15 family glucan-1,4-alpha-glucosidase
MADLFQRSIHVILANQAESGAYVACPNFPAYRYSWFRDGAFIAYAMDLAGQHDSAQRFHDWAARTVLRHADKAERAMQRATHGEPLGGDYLHARYTTDGAEGLQDWPNFQLDGFGTWLWALGEHLRRTAGPLPSHWREAIHLTSSYLAALWRFPCFDLWEEHPDRVHPYTLAAIYAGLQAASRKGFSPEEVNTGWLTTADEIRRFVLAQGVRDGHLVKHVGSAVVDASLIGVATPYRLLTPDDPIMRATAARIEADLRPQGGGVHRYAQDTYYGGGEWVLLAAWLGWYYVEIGETEKAEELQRWVEAQANVHGHLPEQVSAHLLASEHYAEWEARWGPVANPLLWSHAMYLILYCAQGRD